MGPIKPGASLRAAALTLSTFAALATAAQPASAAAGLSVLVQKWTPTNPDASSAPVTVYSNPTLFSDTVGNAWNSARTQVCSALTSVLGKPDLIAHGVTLYDINCTMGAFGSMTLTKTHYGANGVGVRMTIPNNLLISKATQPTACGSECDPKVSVNYDVTVDADLELYPLKIDSASVAISNVKLDSQNFVADIAKALDDFILNGKYQTLAQNAMTTSRALPVDQINATLASIQNPVEPYVDRYLQIGTWVRNGVLTVDFAPGNIANPGGGSITGEITWPKSGGVTIADCSGFTLVGTFDIGPAPLLNPPGNLGVAPTANAGSATFGPRMDAGDHYACAYTMSGLPNGIPTQIGASVHNATAPALANGGGGHFGEFIAVAPLGWTEPAIPAAPRGGTNFQVVNIIGPTKPFGTVTNVVPQNPGGPLENPATKFYNQALATLKAGNRALGITQLQLAYTSAKIAGDAASMASIAKTLSSLNAAIPPAATQLRTVTVP